MNEFFELFKLTFFTNSFIAAAITSILSAVVGSYVVARRNAFISGGITHSSFGGIGVAYYLNANPFLGAAIAAVLAALSIEWTVQKGKVREDSAIAILWSIGMAIGIIFVHLSSGYTPNLEHFLFGNIFSVTQSDLLIGGSFAILCLLLIIIFYRPVLYTAFDQGYADTTGINAKLIKYTCSVVVALAIVLSLRMAGIVLVLSIFTIPQTTALLFTRSYIKICVYSGIFSFVGIVAGIILSYYLDLPSGATIVFALAIIWLIVKSATWLKIKFNRTAQVN